ncbi:MAG TPA: hypothetical protein DCE55_27295 [Planctomycetaceae bacterium]|nr:hypothetical protein [Planctomycetaceae bacterium]|tara:strand:+ start:1369 stop:2205 length:837 start_codon:yes stop_codon:yes gene_type:complete
MRALLVGNSEHPEFAVALCWLRAHLELTVSASLDLALQHLRAKENPQLILLVQSRRNEISQHQIEQLHRMAPLARLVGLLGSWCEGEVRSGEPWKGVQRIYWHQWTPQLIDTASGREPHRSKTWVLPRTTTPAERLLCAQEHHCTPQSGLIGISALSFIDFETLADACQARGLATVWLVEPGLADPDTVHYADLSAILCNGGTSHRQDVHRVTHLAQKFPGLPIIAVVGYPRLDDQQRLLAAGACQMVSKPYLLDELLTALEKSTGIFQDGTLPARSA